MDINLLRIGWVLANKKKKTAAARYMNGEVTWFGTKSQLGDAVVYEIETAASFRLSVYEWDVTKSRMRVDWEINTRA